MIIPIDATTVAVDTLSDLRSVIVDTLNQVNYIYLAADIAMNASSITIPANKAILTIDGTYQGENDPAPVRHTYSDYGTTSADNPIRIASPGGSTVKITFKNMNIIGTNYYGILYNSGGSAYANVTYAFTNVVYNGPQLVFNQNGALEINGGDNEGDQSIINILHPLTNSQEVAEVNRATLSGKVIINHNPHNTNMVFNMTTGNSATWAITIAASADVTIYTNQCLIDADTSGVYVSIGNSAKVNIETVNGFSFWDSDRVSSLVIGANATFICKQTAQRGSYCMFYINNLFQVGAGATVWLEQAYANGNPIFYAYANCVFDIQNPKSLVMKSTTARLINFGASNIRLQLSAGQINYWKTSSTGNISSLPLYHWAKIDQSNAYIKGISTNSVFTLDSTDGTNLNGEELANQPLSGLLLYNAFCFSMGEVILPLHLDPITDDNYPIEGTATALSNLLANYTVESIVHSHPTTADDLGLFTIHTPAAIPLGTIVTIINNLASSYLYAYVKMAVISSGEIFLDTPPEQVRFDLGIQISPSPLIFGRTLGTWDLLVYDTRVRKTPWQLLAAIDADMTSYDSEKQPLHTLPEALVFIDASDNITPFIISAAMTVYTMDDTTGTETVIPITWKNHQGILLRACSQPFHNKEEYLTNITWSLETID